MQPRAIHTQVGSALQTLTTPTPPPLASIEAARHAWGFHLAGNETPEERRELERMLDAVMRFAGEILSGGQPRWLTLCGTSGTGKTFLAKALSAFLAPRLRGLYEKHGRPKSDPRCMNYETAFSYAQAGSRFVKWPRMVDDMREGEYSGYNNACHGWFKIIDEIGGESKERTSDGAEKPTVFAIGKLTRLCDDRLGKWTLWTSNFYRSQLATVYDARIASRMMRDGNEVIELPQFVRDYNLRREALMRVQRAA